MKTIKFISWNIGGAKLLKKPAKERKDLKKKLNEELEILTRNLQPHFLLLQEVAKYGDPSQPDDLVQAPTGYEYNTSISIDTTNQSNPIKWEQFLDSGHWPRNTYLAQGYGLLWKKNIFHSSLWNFTPGKGPGLQKEIVRLDTGLYTGDRDTEPRMAVVSHFIFNGVGNPLDVFIVNLHLTTLKGEREGFPEIDDLGSKIRIKQIEIVLHGIVSRYNQWRSKKLSETKRPPAIWVIGGDLNCSPDSPEINKLLRLNFIDLNPNKGKGTKGGVFPAKKAAITLDYIFAGPAYYSIDPFITQREAAKNPVPLYDVKVSDHFPILGNLPIS